MNIAIYLEDEKQPNTETLLKESLNIR